MTETIFDKQAAVLIGAIPVCEKIVGRKTIVYETRVDPIAVKIAGEKLKDRLFTRFGLLKPKPGEVQLVSINKYYERFILVSGKYVVEYYRKSTYTVEVDKEVLEVVLLNQKFDIRRAPDSASKTRNELKLHGEERLMDEVEASIVLDGSGNCLTLQELPSAPSEKDPKRILQEFGLKEIAEDADLHIIRSRIMKRPKDVARLVNELFESNERVVIYSPRFRVTYSNTRTGEEKTVEFDGVTAQRIRQRKHAAPPTPPPP